MTPQEKIKNCKMAGCKFDMLSTERQEKILACETMDQMFKVISTIVNEEAYQFAKNVVPEILSGKKQFVQEYFHNLN